MEPWKDIASITHYDWSLDGYDQNAPFWQKEKKKEFNDKLLAMVRKRHQEKRIDIFFSYLSGRWVYPETIEKIGDLGIITANISFDDKMLYWGYREGGGLSGNAEIANRYDVCITSQDREDVGKYVHSGANPLFLPAAGNPNIFSYLDLDRTIGVSFIGQCYGVRPKYISYLRKKGIDVRTYGLGWPSGSITLKEMNDVYNRSLINLGFSFINSNDKIRGLKGRDYEIPLAGNLYLTSYHPSLEEVYKIGTEIDCYQDREDLLEKVRFYLNHPDKAMKIGYMGRKRCLQDHIWTNRFAELLTVLRGPA
ncbi:MAG: glycosyltransferase family 1 protein [Methanomassiliicoccus sp.]|nr:glycosyltransferase family 1 protein [Methanomassiliicoccus sp.]